ncbi:MAG: adenylate/guanylate cyclase domain-containing protein [Leptospiraceae bacterium]|nr:adenylate/guanylate cyclase domain-containing protein [Leptospiraceae bacterium]
MPDTIQQIVAGLFLKEQRRSEITIAWVRLLIMLIYLAGGLAVRKEVPAHSLHMILLTTAGGVLLSILVLAWIHFFGFSNRIKYLATTLDILMVALTLWAFTSFRTFKSEAFLVYFLWITLGAMRLSTKMTIYTGLLAIGSYIAIILAAHWQHTVEYGTVTEHFTTPKVSLLNQFLRVLFMSGVVIVAAYITRVSHRLALESAQKELQNRKQEQEKQKVLDTLSRYVTHQIAEKILHEDVSLEGETRIATILFCDIRDFTRLSEQLKASETVKFLNQYFSMMVDIVFKYNGTLDKFIGDEIMAVFGVPISSEQDALNAVQAAAEMHTALDYMNRERQKEGHSPIRIGIGIHTGEVVAGNIGSAKRMEYTVTGPTVNLASRVETLNKKLGTSILLTESTLQLVRDYVQVQAQPAAMVRGIDEPVRTWSLESVRYQ